MTSSQTTPLWLWVRHRASLVRDDGGGFGLQTATTLENCSSLRAKRSNPWHVRKEDGLLRCARNDGCGTAAKGAALVIPRCAIAHRGCALGAGPESITTDGGYGFRA